MMRSLSSLFIIVMAAVIGCSSSSDSQTEVVVHGTAIDHGRDLFADPKTSSSASNRFTCATCHLGNGTPADQIYTGSSLVGVTSRKTFWGGARVDLLESINDCRLSFMDALAPWTAVDDDARAMFAFLSSEPGQPSDVLPAPFTVIHTAPDLPAGDVTRGKIAFDLACKPCHGSNHEGEGRLVTFAPILPDEINATHATLSLSDRRLVFLRKIREGAFVSSTGSMPPFSREALSDADVSAILTFLGQY